MIDWIRVTQLRDEVGADDFGEVVELFLEEVDDAISALEQTPDPEDLEQSLHFLKGSAISLGFRAFADLCQNGERISREGQADSVDLAELIQSFRASRAVFIAELPQRLAA